MNFMFSWQEQYLTSLRSHVRYCSCHSNIKFISFRHRVISSIYIQLQKPQQAELLGELYEQTDVVAMNSPLGALLASCATESQLEESNMELEQEAVYHSLVQSPEGLAIA